MVAGTPADGLRAFHAERYVPQNVVVAAAGNNGKDAAGDKLYGYIHAPGNEPSAITVGAANTFQTT